KQGSLSSTTTPGTPTSLTSRFAPLPSTRIGTRRSRQRAASAASCAIEDGAASTSAFPPTPYHVFGPRGTSHWCGMFRSARRGCDFEFRISNFEFEDGESEAETGICELFTQVTSLCGHPAFA